MSPTDAGRGLVTWTVSGLLKDAATAELVEGPVPSLLSR